MTHRPAPFYTGIVLGALLLAPLAFAAPPLEAPEQDANAPETSATEPTATPASPPMAPPPQEVEEPEEDSVPDADLPSTVPITPPASPPPATGATEGGFTVVRLSLLNKVTARAETVEAPIGSVTRFGTIEIITHSCWTSEPGTQPENAAFLEISEIKQGEGPKRIFLGWMFSSSPGLSSLENPFYDVTVMACLKKKE